MKVGRDTFLRTRERVTSGRDLTPKVLLVIAPLLGHDLAVRLSIATKVFIAFAAVIGVFTVVLMFGIYRTQATYAQIQTVNQTAVPLTLLLSDVQTDLKSFSLVLNEKDPLVLRRTLQVTRLGPSMPERLREKIQRAEALARAGEGGEEQRTLTGAADEISALRNRVETFAERSTSFTDLVLTAREPGSPDIAAKQNELREEARSLDERLSAIRADLQAATDRGLARAKRVERSSLYALSVSSGVALFIAIGVLIAVIITIRRLTALTEATKRIGEGDYRPLETPRTTGVRDEIEELRGEFNAMAVRLQERDEELRDQHAQLLKSERLATIGRMTSLITHELRNPLSSINLNSEMLMEQITSATLPEADQEEVSALLETIIAEVDRLRDITEEYLVYARLPSPKLEQENLDDILQNLVDFHANEWSQAGVGVEVELPDEELLVQVDANQIRQALLNLVRNAVEASPADSVVRLSARGAETFEISVADQGPGISAEAKARIFEPFFTTKSSGTGLGLAMTQQIVEEHGGTLHVDSAPGNGTTFTIRLPRRRAP